MECLSVICSLHVLSISQFYRNQDITVWNNINKPRSKSSCSRFSVTISYASCQDALTFLLCRLMRKSGLSMWKWRYCIPIYIHQLGTGVLRGILGIFDIFYIYLWYRIHIYCMLLYFFDIYIISSWPHQCTSFFDCCSWRPCLSTFAQNGHGDTMVALVLLVFFYWFFRYNEW